MALERFANTSTPSSPSTPWTTLAAGIDASVTSLTVIAFTSFPSAAQYRILIDNELLLVTAGGGTTTWTVTRGVEGSTAAVHASGANVFHTLTAAALALHPRSMTTAGDTEYLGSTGAPTRLAAPGNGNYVTTWTGGVPSWGAANAGDVVGPALSVDNAIVRFDGTTGKLIQNYTSGAPTISDAGIVTLGNVGTAAVPSLSFIASPAAGLWLQATNKIGLTTAGSATSGITIDASGFVGVGITTPLLPLQIGAGTIDIASGFGHQVMITHATQAKMGVYVNNKGISYYALDGTYASIYTYDYGGGSPLDLALNQYGGGVGIGITTPTAVLHLKAGTAITNTSPLKFTSGSLLTVAEAGAVEFLTDAFYGTITTGAARQQFLTFVQGASVADATDAATAITQLNALISRIEAHGLIATV